jgi:hypothetical protein
VVDDYLFLPTRSILGLDTNLLSSPTVNPAREFVILPPFRTLLYKLCEPQMEQFFVRIGLQGMGESFEKGIKGDRILQSRT